MSASPIQHTKRIPKLGMPYMGSKRKIASKIINYILEQNPNAKYFYDLFGGGGAMSFEALQRPQIKQVHYNEYNTGVFELLKDILDHGVTDKYYQWIDRETFMKNKNRDTWLGGLCKVIWSFGNIQRTYLFSKDKEEYKKLLHEIVVNNCDESLSFFNRKYQTHLRLDRESRLLHEETIQERRHKVTRHIKRELGRVDQLEYLPRIENLQRIQNMGQMEQFKITNLSYEMVDINTSKDETIIYLDPPYKNAGKYQKNIDHDKLSIYIEKSPYKIYMSEYKSKMDCVLEIEHYTNFNTAYTKKTTEKLFTNKVKELKNDNHEIEETLEHREVMS